MSKLNIYLIFIIIFISTGIIEAQSLVEKRDIKLVSLEGKPEDVKIELNWLKDKVTFNLSPSETICISNVWSLVDEIKTINGKFILFKYAINAGTGIETQKVVLICIENGRFFKALDIVSMHKFELNKTYNDVIDSLGLYDEYSFYKLTFIDGPKGEQNGYQLLAMEYDTIKSKYDPSINHVTRDTIKFSFDKEQHVFYTEYMSLTGSFFINQSSRTLAGNKYPYIKLKHSGAYYPLIIFEPDEYYFIDGVWYNVYNKLAPNKLVEVSPPCN